ncbi:MAG: DNA primase [Solirubrobacteraceae bacterium]
MTRFAEDSRDRVRDAVDMVDLVSSRTELRRRGHNSYFGRCPFHDEKSPSFHVRPDEKVYHCFGCQSSGDAFTFVMETEGLDFPGALEQLAARYGVTLEVADDNPAAAARRERRNRLVAMLERAADYYTRVLWESDEAAPAREYLAGRGLADDTLRAFRVGYAPSAWDRMLLASRRAGFSEEELLASGLAQRSQKGPVYDRFRERIMFPLADQRGQVLGFGARAMRDNQQPKYLNTSENEVFHKGSQLFGLHVARREASRAGSVVLAEGYTDVLALHQAGLVNSVGLMGTALTDEQVSALARTAPTLQLALDADKAGQAAMMRAAELVARRELSLRVVPLPDGTDPADLLAAEGPDAMRERVQRSVPFVEYRVDRVLAAADVSSAEGRDQALDELRPVLAPLGPSVMREELLRRVAGKLDLSEALTATLVGQGAPVRAPGGQPRAGEPEASAPRPPSAGARGGERAERAFLALCIAVPGPGESALAGVSLDDHFAADELRRAANHLKGRLESPLDDLPADDPELGDVVRELSMRFAGTEVGPDSLEHARLLLELARLRRAIGQARAAGGLEVPELAAERARVKSQIDAVAERLERAGV